MIEEDTVRGEDTTEGAIEVADIEGRSIDQVLVGETITSAGADHPEAHRDTFHHASLTAEAEAGTEEVAGETTTATTRTHIATVMDTVIDHRLSTHRMTRPCPRQVA